MRVVLSDEAHQDLEDAIDYLAAHNPPAAAALIGDVFDLLDRLAVEEFIGPTIALSTGEEFETWPLRPFRLYYWRDMERDELVVHRIYRQSPMTTNAPQ